MDDNLEERVNKFNSTQLPGQPIAVHIGIYYLVNDLWREVQKLRDNEAVYKEQRKEKD